MDNSEQNLALKLLINRLESFDGSISSIDSKVDNLVTISALQERNLAEHMRRSDALERKQEIIEAHLEERLKPVESHVRLMDIIAKAGVAIFSAGAGIMGLIEAWPKIKTLLGL